MSAHGPNPPQGTCVRSWRQAAGRQEGRSGAPLPRRGLPGTPVPPPAGRVETPLGAVLLEEIRRTVDPDVWAPAEEPLPELGRRPGKLALQGSSLVARAPAATHAALHRFLEARRAQAARARGDPPEDGPGRTPAEGDPRLRAEAEQELRGLLRAVETRLESLGQAVAALRDARPGEAQRLLDGVAAQEPDNGFVRTLREALAGTAPVEVEGRVDPTARALADLGRVGSLESWVPRWPSPATWAALGKARDRAGLDGWAWTGADRDRRLDAVSTCPDVGGLPLSRLPLLLSIESLADIRIDIRVLEALRDLRLLSVRPAPRPLAGLLEAVRGQLPPGHRWVRLETLVTLSRDDLPPLLEVQIHDVGDLLAPDAGSAPDR